jgi:hypothetical protein
MNLLPVPALPLTGLIAQIEAGEPFTPAMAARIGVGRPALERMIRAGRIIRLVRGVYVDATQSMCPATRAKALGLVLSRRHLVVDRTAAWVHGAPGWRPRPDAPIPMDVSERRRYPGAKVPVGPGEIVEVGGIRCTTPERTAVDVARHLAPERALPLLDGLLNVGATSHRALIAATANVGLLPGGRQARELTAIADGRAAGVAESVLRLHWLEARLPTPTPGLRVAGHRLALGLPLHRFGVVLAGTVDAAGRAGLAAAGWTVAVVDGHRVQVADPESLGGHLEREFHRHLLSQME